MANVLGALDASFAFANITETIVRSTLLDPEKAPGPLNRCRSTEFPPGVVVWPTGWSVGCRVATRSRSANRLAAR